LRRTALILAAAALLAGPGGQPTGPDITIRVERGDISYDFTRSHKELKSLAQCERPATTGKYLGLSRATLDTTFSSQVAMRRIGRDFTGQVITMDVTLNLNDRVVYVASELPEGTCSFQETLDHEMRHVAIDDGLGALFRMRMARAFREALPTVTGVTGESPEAVKAVIQARMQVVLGQEMRQLRLERHDRQGLVDSTEEYMRLGHSCGGETMKLIAAAEHGDAGWHAPVECP
jgi:hypothetical protein